jgi:hypothetical protein
MGERSNEARIYARIELEILRFNRRVTLLSKLGLSLTFHLENPLKNRLRASLSEKQRTTTNPDRQREQ